MAKQPPAQQLDLRELRQPLRTLGQAGVCVDASSAIHALLTGLNLAVALSAGTRLIATNRLLALGPTRDEASAVRRVLSLQPAYRQHLLTLLLEAVRQLSDDPSLAETLEQLDHLTPELLPMAEATPLADAPGVPQFVEWDRAVWHAPDGITVLSKVVEQPVDVAEISQAPIVVVGFDWLEWETPPEDPAPAPLADSEPLQNPLTTARHPFWGALVATLDGCTGDYPWQSLTLRGKVVRSRHRTLGDGEQTLATLWRSELGLYPAPPLIWSPLPQASQGERADWIPGKPFPWLSQSLEALARAGVATLTEGSWRLTDTFRTRLLQDDEHMLAFEAIRRRSYRLAQAAERLLDPPLLVQEHGEAIGARRAKKRKGTGHAVL